MRFMNAPAFKDNAKEAMADPNLREAMGMLRVGFTARRKEATDGLAEFDDYRARAREIKDHTLANLDTYLELFEENCTAAGGKVHWAPTADDARAA
ncbi:MAG: (Fe-S)-binding protein, partial [Alphaproteobacteria bacterium]